MKYKITNEAIRLGKKVLYITSNQEELNCMKKNILDNYRLGHSRCIDDYCEYEIVNYNNEIQCRVLLLNCENNIEKIKARILGNMCDYIILDSESNSMDFENSQIFRKELYEIIAPYHIRNIIEIY